MGSDDAMIYPLPDLPFLYMSNGRILLAADLHIGIERELMDRGVHVPKQWPAMADMLLSAIRKTRARRVILLGDVKHRIPFASFMEERDVPTFLGLLLDEAEVEIVPGNHDGWLNRLVPEGVMIHPASGVAVGDTWLFHGHCWPSEDAEGCKRAVLGHMHPCISLSDEIGTSTVLPCWLRARWRTPCNRSKDIIVMPATSRLRRGTPVNSGRGIGPLARSGQMNILKARVYLLDGTYLGEVASIP